MGLSGVGDLRVFFGRELRAAVEAPVALTAEGVEGVEMGFV